MSQVLIPPTRALRPSLWQKTKYLNSHTWGRLFGYEPVHPTKTCVYCRNRKRHESTHVNALVPLNYQSDILSSSFLNRYFVLIQPVHSDTFNFSAYLQISKDVSQIQRFLHPDFVLPTLGNIRTELKDLVTSLKVQDTLWIYLRGLVKNGQLVTADNDAYPLAELLPSIVQNLGAFVTLFIVTDVQGGQQQTNWWSLPQRTMFDSTLNKVVSTPLHSTEVSSQLRVYHIAAAGDDDQFSAKFQLAMTESRCRITVAKLLQNTNGICYSNVRFNPRLVHFYFE